MKGERMLLKISSKTEHLDENKVNKIINKQYLYGNLELRTLWNKIDPSSLMSSKIVDYFEVELNSDTPKNLKKLKEEFIKDLQDSF